MRLRFLGTGTSTGVPTIGCDCAVCRSTDPRNKRTRSSVCVEDDHFRILIDAGPDLRSQFLREGLDRLDAVLLTHAHADHILGLDDLRPLSYRRTIPVYADPKTLRSLEIFFPYMFSKQATDTSRPDLDFRPLPNAPFTLGPWEILRIPVFHGTATITAFRAGDLGYVTDCSGIPEASQALLTGVKVLVLDALRHDPHPTHFTVDQAVAMARTLGAERTFFTHISHALDHGPLASRLPAEIQPGYDGLVLDV